MVLDSQRSRMQTAFAPWAAKLAPGGADRLTWISLVLAAFAGLAFTAADPSTAWLLVVGALLVIVSALFDALDGMVARLNKSASPAGDFLDHALDRYADLFIIGGLAASAFGNFRWGFFALTGVFLTSYMATQAAAVGLRRDYGGLLGRADRLVLLTLVPLIQAALVFANVQWLWVVELPWRPSGVRFEYITPIVGLLIAFAVLGHLTALQRFVRARGALLRGESDGASAPPSTPPTQPPIT